MREEIMEILTELRPDVEFENEKKLIDANSRRVESEMKRMKALIVADMGTSASAISEDGYTITRKLSYTPGIFKDNLERLKMAHPDIYTEYVTFSERRNFHIKKTDAEAA